MIWEITLLQADAFSTRVPFKGKGNIPKFLCFLTIFFSEESKEKVADTLSKIEFS